MWWTQKSGGEAVLPVTPERCEASFERHHWKYEREGDSIATSFNDLRCFVAIVKTPDFPEEDFLRVTVPSTEHNLGEEGFPCALEWAEEWNQGTVIGTAKPEWIGEDSGDLRMRVDVSLLCASGLSDAQLDEALMTGVAHGVGAIEAFIDTVTS